MSVCGHCPVTDSRSSAGCPGVDGLYVLVAHAAVTLAPILGEVAASEIAGRREHTMFGRFRPDRFSSLHSSAGASTQT
jgi:glycine/D-amino acid oxidase-like deaminating enzyme